jgi:hypothetical protein
LPQLGKAFGMRCDKCGIDQFFPQTQMQHAVEQRHIGARQNRQMQIGVTRGIGAARISNDNFKLRIIFACFLDAAVQNRMRKSRVRTGDKNHFSVIDIFVTARRRVGTQRLLALQRRSTHRRELLSILFVPIKPLASLLKT